MEIFKLAVQILVLFGLLYSLFSATFAEDDLSEIKHLAWAILLVLSLQELT